MDIASIQKRKFLNNVYKLMYSSGKKPIESEVRKVFSRYFSFNELGKPVNVEYYGLENFNKIDHNILNELMANSLFNMEIMYDALFENNQELFSVVTVLNNKLDGLRAKRKDLESKVDDLLFANSNSDGFFYSFLENFNTVENVDLNLTSAYVDLTNNHVAIPKVSNITSDEIVVRNFFPGNVTFSTTINSQFLLQNSVAENFDTVFDGLNDTYWNHDTESDILGVSSIEFNIPINANYAISAVEGNILTTTPCSIHLKAIPADATKEVQVRTKESGQDFNRFSFSIPADFYSRIYLTLVKYEPDRISNNGSGLYKYFFGLRELSVYSSYYDQRATVISKPISIPTNDNSNLSISAIAIEAKSQIPNGTSLSFFVAPDVDGATDISSFSWMKIDPSPASGNQNIVQLISSNIISKFIDTTSSDLLFIPLNQTSSNINELNPSTLPFSEKTVYRVCSINSEESILSPILLSDIDCLRHYNIILNNLNIDTEFYRSIGTWSDYLNGRASANLNIDIIKDQTTTVNPGLFMASIGLFEGKLLCNSNITVSHTVTKSDPDFNLGIYLNNILIADLPKGVSQKNIEWNFIEGINNISITYDKNRTGNISFNIMNGKSITDYGTLFLGYFNYLDPVQFRASNLSELNVFTIDNLYGNYELLSSKQISNRSNIRYFTNLSQEIEAVRYRIDLTRFANPLQSPFVDSIRMKFKHNDLVI